MSAEIETTPWDKIREKVLERDNYQCRFCEKTDSDHREEYGAGLDVHHIIPKNDGGKDKLQNLAALCRSCHSTLETLHGQAMAEIVEAEDHERTLRGLTETVDKYWGIWRANEELLWEFADENPIFAKEMGIVNETSDDNSPSVESRDLREKACDTVGPITSEWEWVVKFGYMRGVCDVVTSIDGTTDYPIEEFRDD